jgi:hypothetical protein
MSNKTAADIRKAAFNSTVPQETVDVPEWESTVTVKGLSAGAAVDFYAIASNDGEIDQRAWQPNLLIACVYDADGKPVFESANRDMIQDMPSSVVTRLAGIAARLSGLGSDADDEKVIEDFDDGL